MNNKFYTINWNLEQITQRENVNRAYKYGLNPCGKWSETQVHQICLSPESNVDSKSMLSIMGLPDSDFKNLTMLIHALLNKKYYVEISSKYKLDNYISELNKKGRKLNINDVIEIKKHLQNDDISIAELARRYNCSSSSIRKIRDNKTWKNIRYEFNE